MADRAALLAQLAEIDGDQSKGSASVPQPPTAQPSVRRQELLGLLGEVEGGQFELDLARKKYAGQGMFAGGRGTVGAAARTFAIQSLPFGDLGDVQGTSAHAERVKRFQEGKATSEDIDAIAKYEEEQAGLGRAYGKEFMGYKVGKLLPLVGAASKIIPEAEVGGAVIGRLGSLAGKAVPRLGRAGQSLQATRLGRVGLAGGQRVASAPLMPSLYYEQWKQKNVAEGRDPQDIRGLPVPLAQAAAMNLVLGTVQSKIGGRVPTMAGRALTKGAVGAGEDAALHAMQGAWDDIVVDRNKWVGEQYKTGTGYGPLGDLVNGKAGEALKDVAVTALGFSVLAGIHEYGDLYERRQMEREERAELGRRAESRLEGLTKSVHESARQAAADVVRANNDLITAYGTRGMSPEDAGEAIGALYGRVKQAQLAGMSREEAKAQFPAELPSDIRDPLFKLIDRTLPKESNLDRLVRIADTGKGRKKERAEEDLTELANSLGITDEEIMAVGPWAEVADLIRQKQAAPTKSAPPPDLKPTEVLPTAESEGKATEPPTTPAEQRRKEIDRSLHDNLLELPDDATDGQIGQAFQKAGYRLIDGFWVHPDVDPAYVAAISPAAKERMQEHGIYYINEVGGTVFGQQAGGHAAGVVVGGRTIGGIGVNSQGEGIKGGTFAGQDRIALHETAHHVWSGLSPEQKALFEKAHPTTAYAKQHAGGNLAAEENFTERFADNKGDLEKTLREATPAEPLKAETGTEPTRTPESPPEATPEPKTGSDRRVDPQRRKLISEMTAEEARKELVTSRLEDESGGFIELPIPNARGYQEAELASPSKVKAFSDSDGLKALNDTFGYSAGNAMLAAKARVLKELGIDAYHQKGDEFIYRGENEAELRAKLEEARQKLQETEFEYVQPDGTVRRFKGADFSFGVGADLKTASEGMKAHKKEREAKGERGPRAQLGRIREVGSGGEDTPGRGNQGSPEAPTAPAEAQGKGQGPVEPEPKAPTVDDVPTPVLREILANAGFKPGKFGRQTLIRAILTNTKAKASLEAELREMGENRPQRQSQKGESLPEEVEPSEPPVATDPKERIGQLRDRFLKGQLNGEEWGELFDLGKLDARERHIFEETFFGDRLAPYVAKDPSLAKKGGGVLSRERIRQLKNIAVKKLGLDRDAFNVILKARIKDRGLRVARKYSTRNIEPDADLASPRTNKGIVANGTRALDMADRIAKRVLKVWQQEKDNAGGTISPDRATFFADLLGRIDAAAQSDRPAVPLRRLVQEVRGLSAATPGRTGGVLKNGGASGGSGPRGRQPQRAAEPAAGPVGEGESWRDRLAFNGADLSDPAAARKAWEKMDTRERGDFARQVGSVYRDASPAERAEIRDAFIAAVPHAKSEGKSGSVEKFDSTRHDSGESAVVPGDPVRVVEPALVISGYLNGKGGRYVVGKAIVEPQRAAEPAADAGVRKPKWATKESGLDQVLNELGNAEGRTKEALEGALMNAGFLDGEGKPEKNPYEDYSAGERKQQLGRELASAHDYMHRYGQDTAPIERALEAIGAEREGTPGEVVPFNPSVHADVPGLSSGTPVKVLRSGWAVPREGGGFEVVTKAKVEPSNLQPYYSGFPIPKSWLDTISRWVFGSPRGADPHFQPDADPNPHNPRAMPPREVMSDAAATQLGARIHTDLERATTAHAFAKHVGDQVAREWEIAHKNLDAAFPVDPNTKLITLANGKQAAMADVIREETKNPGSQPLTPEQRQAVDIWKGVWKKQLEAMKAAGIKLFTDNQGNELSVQQLLDRGYFPQTVVVRPEVVTAFQKLFGGKATAGKTSKPGAKQAFQKKRKYDEADGIADGVEYLPSFSERVTNFIQQTNRAIADHYLATDPRLGGVDVVRKTHRALIMQNKHLKQSMTKQEWRDHVRWLYGIAKQTARGNVDLGPAFRGKEYSPEARAHLERMFGESQGSVMRLLSAANQELRNLVLSVDLSAGTLQLQGMLFTNPRRWAKSMKAGITEFFNPGTMARTAEANPEFRQAMQEIVQAGGSLGRPELISSLGTGKSIIDHVPVLGPAYTRFARTFETILNTAKVYLWMANRPATPAEWPRTIEAIEGSLGSGRMEQLGMTPERAFLERLFFLAPSYYRGHMKLIQQATSQRGAAGFTARKQLAALATGSLLTGIAGLYAALSQGWISEDELEERLNPLRGKFLMVPVKLNDGERLEVGLGGFYLSMLRTMLKMGDENSLEPLGHWYRGHASSVVRLGADVGTGRDYFGNPTTAKESVLKSVMPIAAQNVAMGEGTTRQNLGQAAAGFFGLRSFPPSERGEYVDRLRKFAKEKTGKTYSDLPIRERARIVREYGRIETRPKVKPEDKQVAMERAAAADAKRVESLTAAVKPETRQKLREFGKTLPGYDIDLAYAGVQIPMTTDERREYEKLLADEYDKEVARWPMDRLRKITEAVRERYMRDHLETAKERARRRLLTSSR